jgi:hypothetical protein
MRKIRSRKINAHLGKNRSRRIVAQIGMRDARFVRVRKLRGSVERRKIRSRTKVAQIDPQTK